MYCIDCGDLAVVTLVKVGRFCGACIAKRLNEARERGTVEVAIEPRNEVCN